ncbi:hypothetical protein [Paraburkholderia sediminicola]|uniref:hypothetical protein n=1 Tax=Paraburkholderia sediminicola TaxID=458836 RepID=UPI0038B9E0BD
MSIKGYPLVPETMANEVEHRRQLAQRANGALQGKLNAVTQVTLTPSSTTTTLTDARIGATTGIFFSPLTNDAVTAQISGLRVSARQKGQATLTHASAAAIDQTFDVLLIG